MIYDLPYIISLAIFVFIYKPKNIGIVFGMGAHNGRQRAMHDKIQKQVSPEGSRLRRLRVEAGIYAGRTAQRVGVLRIRLAPRK